MAVLARGREELGHRIRHLRLAGLDLGRVTEPKNDSKAWGMSGVGPDGMQSISRALGYGLERRQPLGHDPRGLLRPLQRRVERAGRTARRRGARRSRCAWRLPRVLTAGRRARRTRRPAARRGARGRGSGAWLPLRPRWRAAPPRPRQRGLVDGADRGDGERAFDEVAAASSRTPSGSLCEPAEGLVEVEELAERQLAAAEPRHPGVGVLEGERGRPAELSDRTPRARRR